MTTDLAALWHDLTTTALGFDLAALRATILATVDDGLRAASYDSAGGRSADVSSHPERQALNERRDPTHADLSLLDHHEARYVTSVYEIATRSHTGPFPTDWRSARIGARRLDDMDAIGVLETTGQKPARWVYAAGDALHDLELLAGRHMARKANDYEQAWTSGLADEECCDLCLEHLRLRVPRYRGQWCQPHYTLRLDSRNHTPDGQPVDPPGWLSDELRRTGGPGPDWKRARSRWLLDLGPERRSA